MVKVAFQGVYGAYSHIACTKVFKNSEYIACDTFEQAVDFVEKGIADYAIIPVENSNAGRVTDVHFLLPKTKLFIEAEYFLRVEHQLIGLKNAKLSDIKEVYSHPQALSQCSMFLKDNEIKPISYMDTAKSCEQIIGLNNKEKGAIVSKLAAEIYDLEIIQSNIENDVTNTTRFLVMGKNGDVIENDGGEFITSLVFELKHIPAALYKSLGGFASNGLNLNKIESYVVGGNFVSAQFYIEIEAHPSSEAYKNALHELEFYSQSVVWLGTYKKQKIHDVKE